MINQRKPVTWTQTVSLPWAGVHYSRIRFERELDIEKYVPLP